MYVIVGLGNPGSEYLLTRHNVGFSIVDEIASAHQLTWSHQRIAHAYISKTEKYILCKPDTFMNNSGVAVRKVMEMWSIPIEKIFVIHDELDLSLGDFKIQCQKSAAGHNGVQSITDHLQTKEYYRWRVGIGRPSNTHMEIANYVLQKFTLEEQIIIDKNKNRVIESIVYAIQFGAQKAANRYNNNPRE